MFDKMFKKGAKLAHKQISESAGKYYHAIFDGTNEIVTVTTKEGSRITVPFNECGISFHTIPNLTSIVINTNDEKDMKFTLYSHEKIIADFSWPLSQFD